MRQFCFFATVFVRVVQPTKLLVIYNNRLVFDVFRFFFLFCCCCCSILASSLKPPADIHNLGFETNVKWLIDFDELTYCHSWTTNSINYFWGYVLLFLFFLWLSIFIFLFSSLFPVFFYLLLFWSPLICYTGHHWLNCFRLFTFFFFAMKIFEVQHIKYLYIWRNVTRFPQSTISICFFFKTEIDSSNFFSKFFFFWIRIISFYFRVQFFFYSSQILWLNIMVQFNNFFLIDIHIALKKKNHIFSGEEIFDMVSPIFFFFVGSVIFSNEKKKSKSQQEIDGHMMITAWKSERY